MCKWKMKKKILKNAQYILLNCHAWVTNLTQTLAAKVKTEAKHDQPSNSRRPLSRADTEDNVKHQSRANLPDQSFCPDSEFNVTQLLYCSFHQPRSTDEQKMPHSNTLKYNDWDLTCQSIRKWRIPFPRDYYQSPGYLCPQTNAPLSHLLMGLKGHPPVSFQHSFGLLTISHSIPVALQTFRGHCQWSRV